MAANPWRFVPLVDRTCARCGVEFRGAELGYVCPQCRKPKPKPVYRRNDGPLTPREKQLAELISQARVDKEIAEILHLTPLTVKVYVSKLLIKTGMRNRTELALRWARQRGCMAS